MDQDSGPRGALHWLTSGGIGRKLLAGLLAVVGFYVIVGLIKATAESPVFVGDDVPPG